MLGTAKKCRYKDIRDKNISEFVLMKMSAKIIN